MLDLTQKTPKNGFFVCAGGGIRTPVAVKASGLQPDAIDRSATPAWSHLSDSNRGPTVYKTVALPLS